MKVALEDIKNTLEISILGDEAWLRPLYELLPYKEIPGGEKLAGKFLLKKMPYGKIEVQGHFYFKPTLPCSRCDKILTWPIEDQFEVYFQAEPKNLASEKELQLSKEDLDIYFYKNKEIDLFEVLNDAVQLALPERLVQSSEDEKSCLVCQQDLEETVYTSEDASASTQEAAKPSAFDILKNFKVKN